MNTTCAPGPVEFAVLSGAPNNIPLITIAIPANANAPVSGTVNITPLTTMIVYDFLGTQNVTGGLNNPGSYSQAVGYIPIIETAAYQLSGPSAAFSAISTAYQNSANRVLSALSQTLSTYGVSVASGFNPVTASFTANGQGIDAFFDAYPETVNGSNNLQLGSSNPILSVTFGGSSSTPSTLGGSAASSAGGSVGGSPVGTTSSGTSGTANGYNCAPGSYCYAYLGKQFTLTQTIQNLQTGNQAKEVCSGTIASSPTTVTVAGAAGQTAQVALMSGTCSINGMNLKLTGQVGPNIISDDNSQVGYSFPTIETSDGVFSASFWYPTAQPSAPSVLNLNPNASLGAISGTITIN
ncbi:MAG: hypothetical protein PHP05_07880 [Sideroxydans sp.]|nr:hypothetical protein [Sideroxydans sp.]